MVNRQPCAAFWAGRRVLLTGHTGFKGSWLALWLQQLGAEVHGYALPPSGEEVLYGQLGLEDNLASSVLDDLGGTGPGALEQLVARVQPEVVLHLAAQSLVRRSYADPLGTWRTNVIGSLRLLEALRACQAACAVVMVTTDKVYAQPVGGVAAGFAEHDRLGGHDPYSASKAAMELAVASWRSSFCGAASHQTPHLAIATARAGNVIGGGDWAEDRIVPDAMRALARGEVIQVRQPEAIRPWQHVLDPLAGYLLLAQRLLESAGSGEGEQPHWAAGWNFGPDLADQCSVAQLVELVLQHWPGQWQASGAADAPHEAACLRLNTQRARALLGWQPRWASGTAVQRTVGWYRRVAQGSDARSCCLADLEVYGDIDASSRYQSSNAEISANTLV